MTKRARSVHLALFHFLKPYLITTDVNASTNHEGYKHLARYRLHAQQKQSNGGALFDCFRQGRRGLLLSQFYSNKKQRQSRR